MTSCFNSISPRGKVYDVIRLTAVVVVVVVVFVTAVVNEQLSLISQVSGCWE